MPLYLDVYYVHCISFTALYTRGLVVCRNSTFPGPPAVRHTPFGIPRAGVYDVYLCLLDVQRTALKEGSARGGPALRDAEAYDRLN